MAPRIPRPLVIDLPPMTPAQAAAVFRIFADLMHTLWEAYEPELLEAAGDDALLAHEEDESIEAEELELAHQEPTPPPEPA